MTTIRDLVRSTATVTAGDLRDVVTENPPLLESRSSVEDRLGSSMPGDNISDHPLNYLANNPYSGKNPLQVRRALVNQEITDPEQRRLATEWLDTYQRFSGDKVWGSSR